MSVMKVWRSGLERRRGRLGQVGVLQAGPGGMEGGLSSCHCTLLKLDECITLYQIVNNSYKEKGFLNQKF